MKKWIMAVSSILLILALAAGCGTANNDNNNGGNAGGNGTEQGGQAGGGGNGTEQGGQAGGAAGGRNQNAQKIYQGKCTSCHGQNLEGATGPSLNQVGSRYKSADEIQNVIVEGRNGMPGGLVSEADAKVLADWLMTQK